jgi:hypothetical protein
MSEVDRSNEALGRIREEQRGWPAAAEPGIRPALGDQMLGDQILDTFRRWRSARARSAG